MVDGTRSTGSLRSPLANACYRRLFGAQVIALVGTGLTTIALTLLAYDLADENAGAVVGIALALKMVVYVFGAHRSSRRSPRGCRAGGCWRRSTSCAPAASWRCCS